MSENEILMCLRPSLALQQLNISSGTFPKNCCHTHTHTKKRNLLDTGLVAQCTLGYIKIKLVPFYREAELIEFYGTYHHIMCLLKNGKLIL